ncbi:MAG: hypothetical protein PHH08_03700, partial [Candidatus ainarchaeum sp.]|nr:hypothetical protein [Candidatus ainarchaeum sp.]
MTHPKFILAGLFLIFISVFSQQAFAANSTCSDISIDAHAVRITVGDSIIEGFSIRNSGQERFFIDSAVVSTASRNFTVQTNGFDRTILSGGTGTVNVKVTGRIFNETEPEMAFIELRGHFLGGRTCELQDFGKRAFKVIIEKKPVSGTFISAYVLPSYNKYCENLALDAPKNVEIRDNLGWFEITIDNQSGSRANARISAKNGVVNPSLISVPKKSKITETIAVETSSEKAEIEFLVENLDCSFKRKTSVNSVETRALAGIVKISASLPGTGTADYELIVSMRNRSGKTVSGNIGVLLPNDWNLEGTTQVALGPFETKEIEFRIIPEEALQNPFNSRVSFTSN